MCLSAQSPNMPKLFEFQSFVRKQIVSLFVLLFLNLNEHHNGIIGSKVTTILVSISVFLIFWIFFYSPLQRSIVKLINYKKNPFRKNKVECFATKQFHGKQGVPRWGQVQGDSCQEIHCFLYARIWFEHSNKKGQEIRSPKHKTNSIVSFIVDSKSWRTSKLHQYS